MTNTAIARFWATFAEHRDPLAIPEDPPEDQMMLVLNSLKEVDPRLYYHIGHHGSGVDLVLSAEGHFDLSQTITDCLALAPELPGWGFRAILDTKALSGDRDEMLFPDDENGDVLFDIAEHFGDLITVKDVEFCHVFPSEEAGGSFTKAFDDSEGIDVEEYAGDGGFNWQAVVTRRMIPSHTNISEQESSLAAIAAVHGGRPDGWGFLSA